MKSTRAAWLVTILGIILLGAAAPCAQAQNLSQIKQIAAGANHACALLANGTVACWGYNYYGQLGNGTTTNSNSPVEVANLSHAVAIAAGGNHTCALLSGGTVWCWGFNALGQLGHETGGNPSSTPVEVTGLHRVVAIAAGSEHTCAVLSNGKAKCWGYNGYGQLGDGNTTSRKEAKEVSGLISAVAIAAAANHTCALLSGGTVQCWGYNSSGQLGDGTDKTNSTTPVEVMNVTDAVAIAAGGSHTCALLASGTVECWGDNGNGQLGNGTTTSHGKAYPVSNLSNAVAISAGGDASGGHTCAVLSGGTVQCWGLNDYGQLGYSTGSNNFSATPENVGGLSGAVEIAAGGRHNCAVLSDGKAKCWGDNGSGQLGDGQFGGSLNHPIAVTAVSSLLGNGATDVAVGQGDTCALLGDGTVKCWGLNNYGQLGNGSTDSSGVLNPVHVIDNATGAALQNVVAIAAGGNHTCALRSDGKVLCWGYNFYGQLGDGFRTSHSKANKVGNLSNAVAIAAGRDHTCALLTSKTEADGTVTHGTVECWGGDDSGQLGSGRTDFSGIPNPVQVTDQSGTPLQNVVAISAGEAHTCALLADGTVRCWGYNNYGQVGDGTSGRGTNRLRAQRVVNLSNAIAISAGGNHTCALLADGTVQCWGMNNHGDLGNGTSTNSSTPVEVVNVTDAVAVSAGLAHTCALLADGKAKCWGQNVYGQLGDGNTTNRKDAKDVTGLSDAAAISAGYFHTCALLANGTVTCWGYNYYGQLGNGATTQATTPVPTSPLF